MKVHLLLLFTLTTVYCLGQVQTNYISPVQTDPNYSSNEDSSAVSWNDGAQQNKLFLFIGGTNSSSSTDYNALRLHAANLGFDFINLSYPNSVPAASLANSNDSLVFDKYRQEIVYGTPVSNDVSVDSLNSIYTRTLKLIQYLEATYPSENWGQYLTTSNTIDWSKIIVGGHSQGSGHACCLAKQHLVNRVLMFSGPNDYSDYFSNSAHWLRQAGVTPTGKHFAYLSLNDEIVDFSKQFVNISGLDMLLNDDTTYVDNITSPYGNSQSLYTTQPPEIAIINHNVPIKLSTINSDVWTYMLTSEFTTGIENTSAKKDFTIYPNPTSDGIIFIKTESLQNKLSYSIYNSAGQLIRKKTVNQANVSYTINISDLKKGIYILKVKKRAMKIIKQ